MNRVEESINTGTKKVAVIYSFCQVMISDGVTAIGYDTNVVDVAEVSPRTIKKSLDFA